MVNLSSKLNDNRMDIYTAIRQMRMMEFFYHGGNRTVEPFALGIVKKGNADNESLVCYQTSGHSELQEAVGWKLYRASEMENIEVLKEKFTGDRPGYDPKKLGMVRIICCVWPVKKAEKELKALPEEQLKVAMLPLTATAPPGTPEVKLQPVIRYLTHNELMKRFRYAHPIPILDLDIALWPEPLVAPFPERVKLKIWPRTPVLGTQLHYLIGQTAGKLAPNTLST